MDGATSQICSLNSGLAPITGRAELAHSPWHQRQVGSQHLCGLEPKVRGCSKFRACLQPNPNRTFMRLISRRNGLPAARSLGAPRSPGIVTGGSERRAGSKRSASDTTLAGSSAAGRSGASLSNAKYDAARNALKGTRMLVNATGTVMRALYDVPSSATRQGLNVTAQPVLKMRGVGYFWQHAYGPVPETRAPNLCLCQPL